VRHRHTTQLRWSEPDMLGHLIPARILSLTEDARLALLADDDERALWSSYVEDGS
jgi:acyl-CoA thioester hydrolase